MAKGWGLRVVKTTQILFVAWGHVAVVSTFAVEYPQRLYPAVQVGIGTPVFPKHSLEWILGWIPIEYTLLCLPRFFVWHEGGSKFSAGHPESLSAINQEASISGLDLRCHLPDQGLLAIRYESEY